MGDRVTSLRRKVARVAACTFVLACGAIGYSACGLSVTATGGPVGDGSTSDTGSTTDDDGGARDNDADASQGGCTPDRVVCGTECTDITSDPLNCGACGKKCGAGQTCSDSQCTVLCVSDKQNCGGTCVDITSDPLHCGSCTKVCTDDKLLCVSGACAEDCGALTRCTVADAGAGGAEAAICANLQTDNNNCGMCGKVCKNSELCTAGVCKPVCVTTSRIGDVFAPNMVGCVATVEYSSRGSVCPTGATVCTGQQFVDRRAAKVPTYNYWTNDDLRWGGTSNNCYASKSQGNYCGSSFRATPMRVCGKKTDPAGNQCNWTNCGLNGTQPNQYFGGCQDNRTAGSLCCFP